MSWAPLYHGELHSLLCARREMFQSPDTDDGWEPNQALFCPYYVPLEGKLGSDWGVIVNPASAAFGQVVFEHEWCGCPDTPHGATPSQDGDMWDMDWRHEHDEWCGRRPKWKHCEVPRRFLFSDPLHTVPRLGYLADADDAERRLRQGQRQVLCGRCERWAWENLFHKPPPDEWERSPARRTGAGR